FVPVRIFNKDFKIINLVHIDGNMSPEYAPPKGAGIARLIGGGINTRGFISGESTEITSSTTPDVTFSTFMISIVLNLFPFLKKICLFSSNLYDQIDSLNATVNSKFAKNTNTLLINISNKLDEIKKFEIANSIGAKTLAIASVDTVAHLPAAKQKIETKIIKINGEKIKINILLNQTKIAGGYIDIITIDYDKENVAYSVDEILSNITPYILDQIVNNKYAKYIKNRSNIALINNDLSNTFDLFNKRPNKKLSKILEKTFGVIPILYDVRNKKSIPIITELTQTITLDKTRKMLAAA
ncbi:MAG: hypothetical protein PHG84_06165, partial [Endomicrobiaceae bacterium]|nr:hypothetical protein [Endomicrobiaceae bacterium]